jgi:hypothetical protein
MTPKILLDTHVEFSQLDTEIAFCINFKCQADMELQEKG